MPPHNQKTANPPPNRPITRPKNATAHPGTDAQRVLSNRRDPEIIEKEKLERKSKKEAKEHQKAEEVARKEAARQRVEELRAQQAIELDEEESHPQLKGNKKNVQGAISEKGEVKKGSSSVTVKPTNTATAITASATSAGYQGQKRKNDMRQDDAGPDDSHDEHPPAKKGKALPAASADQPTHPVPRPRPVPRPVQKKPQVVQEEETMDPPNRHNAKKRPSEAADPENDPKTPVPSKKAKVGLNEKSKSAPLRRTETMIELVGSKVVTRKPTDIDLDTTSELTEEDNESHSRTPTEDVDIDNEPYQTPVALTPANQKNKARVLAEDTEVESSEIEVVERKAKKQQARTSAVDKPSATGRPLKTSTQRIGNKTRSTTSLSSRNSSAAPKSLKSRTTALNEVAAARSLDGPTSKLKSKAPTATETSKSVEDELEIASAIGDEDDTKEREAALASPMKGKDSRQLTATQVKVERREEEILSSNEKKKVKDDIIPHFMQKYTSQNDCFAPLTEKDFRLLEDLWHRTLGRPLPYKLTKNSEVVKMVSAKLSDYRTQFRIQGDNNAKSLLNVYFDGDTTAIQDKQKRIDFGLYYCMEDEYKFQFRGSERLVGKFKASGRFLSKIFLDTFSIHYRYTLPKNPLPNWDTPIPVGSLALAAAAIDRALTLYRDDHYEYKNGTLSIKQPPVSQAAKERAIKNRAARGGLENEIDKVPCTSRFHFSKGKYGNIVLAWHGVLVQKAEPNFPDICAQARQIFGIANAEGNSNHLARDIDPEIRTRVGLDSEPESGSEKEDEDKPNDGDASDERDNNGDSEDPEDDQNSDMYASDHDNNGDNNTGNSDD